MANAITDAPRVKWSQDWTGAWSHLRGWKEIVSCYCWLNGHCPNGVMTLFAVSCLLVSTSSLQCFIQMCLDREPWSTSRKMWDDQQMCEWMGVSVHSMCWQPCITVREFPVSPVFPHSGRLFVCRLKWVYHWGSHTDSVDVILHGSCK